MELTREQQLFQQVINEAWENETFKKDLIANPVVAIEKLTGKKVNIPEGKTLVVRDQTDEATVFINIPVGPNMEDVELNEEQLDVVSGGCFAPYGGLNPSDVNKPITILFPPPQDYDNKVLDQFPKKG